MTAPPLTEERKVTSVRLPADLYEWVRREAFERREPMLAIVVRAIRRLQEESKKD